MSINKPSPSCPPGRPVAPSSSRASGSSQASSSNDIELPVYSSSQPSHPPPSYGTPGSLFPNYRLEKQGPAVPAEPAIIEEGRAVRAVPARPAPVRVSLRQPAAPAPAPAPVRQAQPAGPPPRPVGVNARARHRSYTFFSLVMCTSILAMIFWMLWHLRLARERAARAAEQSAAENNGTTAARMLF